MKGLTIAIVISVVGQKPLRSTSCLTVSPVRVFIPRSPWRVKLVKAHGVVEAEEGNRLRPWVRLKPIVKIGVARALRISARAPFRPSASWGV
jgi:hypothetical protein